MNLNISISPTTSMFCNNIEETLFAPLPPSLWTDYYNDRTADGFGKGILRRNRPRSSLGTLLPAPCHFQSLPPTRSDDFAEGGRRDDSCGVTNVDEAFHDEFTYPAAPSSPSSSTAHPSGQAVKSLFHDGCLFAYSPPTSDRDGSIRAVMRRAKGSLSPRSRRRVRRMKQRS
jgi:hypothetical protein